MQTPHSSAHWAIGLLLAATPQVLSAQDAAPWDGWERTSGGADQLQWESGQAMLRGRADAAPVVLTRTAPFGDGSIDLAWRVRGGCGLWLRVREAEGEGLRILLAAPEPAGAIVGLDDGERADASAERSGAARVRLDGARIEVTVGGRDRPHVALDPRNLSGSLGLEVRGDGVVRLDEPTLEAAGRSRWQTVLDGSEPIDPTRWQPIPGGTWQIEDGVLAGFCAQSEPRHGILLSTFEVDDFAARLVYRAVQGNSGFYFRCEPVRSAVGVHGFQAEIDATRDAGMLYETGGRARVQIPPRERVERAFRPGEWNEMLVVAEGRRVEVYVNGVRMTRLVDDPGRLKGRIGLQLHGGQDMRVELRSLQLLEGPAERR